MVVDHNGLHADRLTPELARLLGGGEGIVAEASMTQCAQIAPVHVLAYLSRAGSVLRTELLEPRRVSPELFCQSLYDVSLDDDRPAGMPLRFRREELSARSVELWDAFDVRLSSTGSERGTEALFLTVLIDHLDEAARRLLASVAGSEEAFQHFRRSLERRIAGVVITSVFDENGVVIESGLDKSGRRALRRLGEEAAALGCKRATSMHVLYALVGLENGLLQRAIQFQAIEPLKEVHAYLSRELARPGGRRAATLELSRATLHEAVQRILESATGEAQRQGVPTGEVHIARALLAARAGMVVEFLTARKINVEILREYLTRTEQEVEEATDNRRLPVGLIEASLRKNLLGQEHAIRRILPWIKALRFGFPRDRGPAAVLLFLGPSGTGKTQLAKELARTVYGSEDDLVMLEMGQFNAKESINQFIGAPPGYVGYGEGKLTNGLRDKPQCVVLFDEIEKAHEDVWVALLRFLDEGLISDPAGPTRDGRRCIVVLTSNIGADKLAAMLPPDALQSEPLSHALEEAIRDEVMKYLKRPEIYNRVDDKVVFRPFSADTYRELVAQAVGVETRKFSELFNVSVTVQPDVIEWLAGQAVRSSKEGARCVPRLINRFVVSPVIDVVSARDDHQVRRVVVSKLGDATTAEEP